jgi:hypothetical protein
LLRPDLCNIDAIFLVDLEAFFSGMNSQTDLCEVKFQGQGFQLKSKIFKPFFKKRINYFTKKMGINKKKIILNVTKMSFLA